MKWEEIEQKFQNEWVIVEVTRADEDYEVLEGNVLYHDPNDDRFWKEVKQFKPKTFTIRYIGEPPKDWAVML